MRFIVLGASNVTLAFPRLWHGLRRSLAEPMEVFAAHGHGRSFGTWSRVGPRELPGIIHCRLWDDLASQPSVEMPARALVTDIGNDLLYGADPEQIAKWVAVILQRLKQMEARVVLTQLPVASVLKVGRVRFQFLRKLLFPNSRFQFEELESKVNDLNRRIVELGRESDVPTRELRHEWYGFDPIHIRRSVRAAAWRELLSPWFENPQSVDFRNVNPAESLRIWRQRPAERRWFGRVQETAQPILNEARDLKLWLY